MFFDSFSFFLLTCSSLSLSQRRTLRHRPHEHAAQGRALEEHRVCFGPGHLHGQVRILSQFIYYSCHNFKLLPFYKYQGIEGTFERAEGEQHTPRHTCSSLNLMFMPFNTGRAQVLLRGAEAEQVPACLLCATAGPGHRVQRLALRLELAEEGLLPSHG